MPQPASAPPPRPEFLPRREFIREQKSTPNVFAIIAVSGSSFIRLYSLPQPVVAAFQRLFDDLQICLTVREVDPEHFCEFTLDGKPWANTKSVTTEKLLVDIFAIMFRFGYTYLSNLDYGRDVDDLLAVAFSKPSILSSASREGTPNPESSSGCSRDKHKPHKAPFALSFASATIMRVISPPLHLTPAILQAVRGAWPRGVVTEKKVGDNSFEFKLKGYKWFQQDNFATDSLRHILALLTSLDAQSFTLLCSISLKNRSRVKDLWIFTGPPSVSTEEFVSAESSPFSTPDPSYADIKRPIYMPDSAFRQYPIVNPGVLQQHRRLATEPNAPAYTPQPLQSVPENPLSEPQRTRLKEDAPRGPMPSSLLRKPAPRAQVPISVVNEPEVIFPEGVRANLPSVVSSTAEDMTGVGTPGFSPGLAPTLAPYKHPEPNKQYSSSPVDDLSPSSYSMSRIPARSATIRERGPPMIAYNPGSVPNPRPQTDRHGPKSHKVSSTRASPDGTRPGDVVDGTLAPAKDTSFDSSARGNGSVSGMDPSTGASETRRGRLGSNTGRALQASQDRIRHIPMQETGDVVGTSPLPSSPPPSPGRVESPILLDNQGWVLVNVDVGGRTTSPANGNASAGYGQGLDSALLSSPAQAIAMMDAMDANKANARTHQRLSSAPVPPSPMKRLFGLVSKNQKNARRISK